MGNNTNGVIPMGKTEQATIKKNYQQGQSGIAGVRNNGLSALEIPSTNPATSRNCHFNKELVAYFQPKSFAAEQFRKMAATVAFHYTENDDRCLLITSPIQGDGKSFFAANLAVSLAKSLEESVLLMDCDLRRPRLHTLFGLGNILGLSDHFVKGIELSALIQETGLDHLSILTAGNEAFHSAELLSSKRMAEVLRTVKSLYEKSIILIDSPPPSTTESVAIARRVDKTIVVVKYDKTPKGLLEDLITTIGKEKIMGVAINQSRRRIEKYHRYYA